VTPEPSRERLMLAVLEMGFPAAVPAACAASC